MEIALYTIVGLCIWIACALIAMKLDQVLWAMTCYLKGYTKEKNKRVMPTWFFLLGGPLFLTSMIIVVFLSREDEIEIKEYGDRRR